MAVPPSGESEEPFWSSPVPHLGLSSLHRLGHLPPLVQHRLQQEVCGIQNREEWALR